MVSVTVLPACAVVRFAVMLPLVYVPMLTVCAVGVCSVGGVGGLLLFLVKLVKIPITFFYPKKMGKT